MTDPARRAELDGLQDAQTLLMRMAFVMLTGECLLGRCRMRTVVPAVELGGAPRRHPGCFGAAVVCLDAEQPGVGAWGMVAGTSPA